MCGDDGEQKKAGAGRNYMENYQILLLKRWNIQNSGNSIIS